jgi:hypothetical protein
MKIHPVISIALLAADLLAVGLLGAGCSNSEGDTAPLPPQDPKVRLESAQRGIESSKMSPEQKRAAAEYLRQGAEGAQRMRESAEKAGRSVGKS